MINFPMQLNAKGHLFREVLKSISLHKIANKVADLYLRMTSREKNMAIEEAAAS
jgi:hypothetical protein